MILLKITDTCQITLSSDDTCQLELLRATILPVLIDKHSTIIQVAPVLTKPKNLLPVLREVVQEAATELREIQT